LREGNLQRREATALFREICDCFPDDSILSSVILKNHNNAYSAPTKYELHIKAFFGASTLKNIKAIVKKHQLTVKESNGYLIIAAPERKIIEITA
jgi:hypothetical protein